MINQTRQSFKSWIKSLWLWYDSACSKHYVRSCYGIFYMTLWHSCISTPLIHKILQCDLWPIVNTKVDFPLANEYNKRLAIYCLNNFHSEEKKLSCILKTKQTCALYYFNIPSSRLPQGVRGTFKPNIYYIFCSYAKEAQLVKVLY